MTKSKTITVEHFDIALYSKNEEEFISLTDMARYRDAERTGSVLNLNCT